MGTLALRCIDTEETQRPRFKEIVELLKQLSKESATWQKGVAPSSAQMPAGTPLGAVARNGPLLGAAPAPAWAAGAQVRGGGYAQQPERHTAGGQPGVGQQERGFLAPAAASSAHTQQDRQRVPVALASRSFNHGAATKASGSTSRPGGTADAPYLLPRNPLENPQLRRGSDPLPADSGSRNPASSFSHVGSLLCDAASTNNVREAGADMEASSRPAGIGASSSASAAPAYAHRMQNGEFQGTPITGDRSRMASQHRGGLNAMESPDGALGGIDDTPAAVVDCGAMADRFVGSETPPPSPGGPGARDWTDPRTEPAQGGKAFLLPPLPRQEGGRSLRANQAGEAGAYRPAECMPERPAQSPTTNSGDRQDREELMQRVMEMGFSEYQAGEAVKRCSTEAACVEWILDPEREWNM